MDVSKLFAQICQVQDPASEVVLVKYFIAEISPNHSKDGNVSYKAQADYLLALEKHCSNLEVIRGKFMICPASLYSREEGTRRPRSFVKTDVWRPEEKQTDVNIALRMICDAFDGKCDQQVLVSNDSDLYPVLKELRSRNNNITQGIIAPIRGCGIRRPSSKLKQYANWTRSHIKELELSESQLPKFVQTRKRRIDKPSIWSDDSSVEV